jgi:hypothetical protein
LKGVAIINRPETSFAVAHRIEAGLTRLEFSIGSGSTELYWDVSARDYLADQDRYGDLRAILIQQGVGWLIEIMPTLANDPAKFTAVELSSLAAAQS